MTLLIGLRILDMTPLRSEADEARTIWSVEVVGCGQCIAMPVPAARPHGLLLAC